MWYIYFVHMFTSLWQSKHNSKCWFNDKTFHSFIAWCLNNFLGFLRGNLLWILIKTMQSATSLFISLPIQRQEAETWPWVLFHSKFSARFGKVCQRLVLKEHCDYVGPSKGKTIIMILQSENSLKSNPASSLWTLRRMKLQLNLFL